MDSIRLIHRLGGGQCCLDSNSGMDMDGRPGAPSAWQEAPLVLAGPTTQQSAPVRGGQTSCCGT